MLVGGGGKYLTGRGLWSQNYGWSWMVVGGGSKIMAGRGWSWIVVGGSFL